MRKIVVPTMIAAVLASTTLAFAIQQMTGTVKSVDTMAHKFTLSDGMAFNMTSGLSTTGWKVGDKVQVSYDTSNGVHTATMVSRVQ
jgi:Cu/Ag efflux protein CusF